LTGALVAAGTVGLERERIRQVVESREVKQ